MKQNYKSKNKGKKEQQGMSFFDEDDTKTIDLVDNTGNDGNGKPKPDSTSKSSQDQPEKPDVDEN